MMWKGKRTIERMTRLACDWDGSKEKNVSMYLSRIDRYIDR